MHQPIVNYASICLSCDKKKAKHDLFCFGIPIVLWYCHSHFSCELAKMVTLALHRPSVWFVFKTLAEGYFRIKQKLNWSVTWQLYVGMMETQKIILVLKKSIACMCMLLLKCDHLKTWEGHACPLQSLSLYLHMLIFILICGFKIIPGIVW